MPLLLLAHQANNLTFCQIVCVMNKDVHEKPIHLRFRQRIGAFLLNRVLGGHDHEKRGKFMGGVGNGNLPFLHGL